MNCFLGEFLVTLLEGDKKLVKEAINYISINSKFNELKKYKQHGHTSVYEHCVNVTCLSLWLCEKAKLNVNKYSLIKGALLHDYFLYDWHIHDKSHMLHGFTHSNTALKNALKTFHLNEIEKDIISKHMFPLTPFLPRYKESWIVTFADKISSIFEVLRIKNKLM